jgi:hypothetical protein
VVTTFDPDGIVATYHLGWNASTVDELADHLKMAIEPSEQWHAASRAARLYYLNNHTVDAAMARFERVFLETVKK